MLAPSHIGQYGAFGVRVGTEICQRWTRDARARSHPQEPQIQIALHTKMQGWIKPARAYVCVTPPETAGLNPPMHAEIGSEKTIGPNCVKPIQHTPGRVHVPCIPKSKHDVAMSREKRADARERAHQIGVIGIEPRQNFAGRARETLRDRIGLSFVWSDPRITQPGFVFANDLCATIRIQIEGGKSHSIEAGQRTEMKHGLV